MVDKTLAQHILTLAHATNGADFHTLSSSQVDTLLEYADSTKYRKPANANGSRGRYFYAYLQRVVNHKDKD